MKINENLSHVNWNEGALSDQTYDQQDGEIRPELFLNIKQKRKWNKIPINKRQRIIQKEAKQIFLKKQDARSEDAKKKGKICGDTPAIWSGKDKKENTAHNLQNIGIQESTKVIQEGIKTNVEKTADSVSGGSTFILRTAKKTADKFKVAIENQALIQKQNIQKMMEHDRATSDEENSYSYQIGKRLGSVAGIAMAPILKIAVTVVSTILSTLVSVLVPILCIILFLVLVVTILTTIFGGTSSTLTSGNLIAQIAEQELTVSSQNIGGGKYKAWYGMNADWCAMFVSWCADQCGYIDSGIMPKSASVLGFQDWYKKNNLYQAAESGYQPQKGDIVIFLNGMSHTGIVADYDPGTDRITTIEGNSGISNTSPFHLGSKVTKNIYPRTARIITGYGTPNYPDSVTGNLPGNSNAEKIFNGCIQAGYSPEASAGIIGNLYQEAGEDSAGDINLHSVESTGEGVGMVQWSFGRKKEFLKFCEQHGQPWPHTGVELQLNFMLYELSTNQWIWSRNSAEYGASYNISLDDFKHLKNVDFATTAFCAKFERCHLKDAHLEYRKKKAREALQSFGK